MTAQERYRIQVTDMDRFTDKGNLKAFADIKIGSTLRIYGFRIVQQPNQQAWVSPPQRTWQDKTGTTKYAPIVELSGDLKVAVDEAILAAWGNS